MKFGKIMREIFIVDAEIGKLDGAEARGVDQVAAREFNQLGNARRIFAATNFIADGADGLIDRRINGVED